jgi:hypothetical protein
VVVTGTCCYVECVYNWNACISARSLLKRLDEKAVQQTRPSSSGKGQVFRSPLPLTGSSSLDVLEITPRQNDPRFDPSRFQSPLSGIQPARRLSFTKKQFANALLSQLQLISSDNPAVHTDKPVDDSDESVKRNIIDDDDAGSQPGDEHPVLNVASVDLTDAVALRSVSSGWSIPSVSGLPTITTTAEGWS